MQPQVLKELTHVFSEIPFNRMLGLSVDVIEDDKIVMSFQMKPDLIGNVMHGILHGGVISSVIDMAGGVAAIASAVRKQANKNMEELKSILSKSSTVNLHINYICPGKGDAFTATAWILRSGNKICFTRSELRNQDNTLIATGSATYLVG